MTSLSGVFLAQDCLDVVTEFAAGAVRELLALRRVSGAFALAVNNTVNYKLRSASDNTADAATVLHLESRKVFLAEVFGLRTPTLQEGHSFNAGARAQLRSIERLLLLAIQTDAVLRVTVHDATAEHLRFIRHAERLVSLDMSLSPTLNRAALEATLFDPTSPPLPSQQTLARIDLSGCFAMTDDALGLLASGLPRLEMLRLAGVDGITVTGIRALGPVARTSLVTLDLAGVRTFNDEAMAVIAADFTTLVMLDASFTGVTAEGVASTIGRPSCAAQSLQQLRLHSAIVPEAVGSSARLKRIVRAVAKPSFPTPAPPEPRATPARPTLYERLSVPRDRPAQPQHARTLMKRATATVKGSAWGKGGAGPRRRDEDGW